MQIAKYDVKKIQYDNLKNVVKLPQFQRNVVWKEDARKKFIDTIKKGYPFGSLLLYEAGNGCYEVVDGLQRLSTLMHCEQNKNEYINIDELAVDELNRLIVEIEASKHLNGVILQSQVVDGIKNIIKDEVKCVKKGASPTTDAADKIIEKYPSLDSTQIYRVIVNRVENIIKKVEEDIDFSKLDVPVVIFTGDKHDLPEIFSKVNSGGTKLSTYEILAATWSGNTFEITDSKILETVDKKYSVMVKKADIEISGYEEGAIIESKRINLFEYSYALGKLIIESCPVIFDEYKNDDTEVDSIGFKLLATSLGKSVKKISELESLIGQEPNSQDLIDLKEKIVRCSKEVDEILRFYILSPDRKNYTKFIENQMISIISALFKIRYTKTEGIKFVEREGSKKYVDRFTKFMPKYYLSEMIEGYWGGSGDSKVDEILSKDFSELKYVSDISDDVWRPLLESWLNGQLEKDSVQVDRVVKLFLNYLFKTSSLSAAFSNSNTFDIEHIVPISRLKDKLKNGPFSALGNLCLLPVYTNRSKKELTIYEQSDYKNTHFHDESVLDNLFYAKREELEFLKGEGFTREKYTRFLKDRNNFIIEKFIVGVRSL